MNTRHFVHFSLFTKIPDGEIDRYHAKSIPSAWYRLVPLGTASLALVYFFSPLPFSKELRVLIMIPIPGQQASLSRQVFCLGGWPNLGVAGSFTDQIMGTGQRSQSLVL